MEYYGNPCFFSQLHPQELDDKITVLAIFDLSRIGGAAGSGRTAGDDAREDGSDQEPMAPRGGASVSPHDKKGLIQYNMVGTLW